MWGGKISFYLFFFVNRFLFVQFYTIIIIKCKALFSCHSSSSHYSTQGFVLISFHFIFSYLKNKFIHFYMWSSVFFPEIRFKCRQDCRKVAQKLQSDWFLERKCFCFLITPPCFHKQQKCRSERTFNERDRLA